MRAKASTQLLLRRQITVNVYDRKLVSSVCVFIPDTWLSERSGELITGVALQPPGGVDLGVGVAHFTVAYVISQITATGGVDLGVGVMAPTSMLWVYRETKVLA